MRRVMEYRELPPKARYATIDPEIEQRKDLDPQSPGQLVVWLDAPDNDAPAETGPMTAEMMLDRWTGLVEDCVTVDFASGVLGWNPVHTCKISSDSRGEVAGEGRDPLKAFEQAYRAWEEAQAK